MKIVICCSMSAISKAVEIADELEKTGHEVTLPENVQKHLKKVFNSHESIEEKIKNDLIKGYFVKIKESDAVLVVNEEKNGIKNYIGGNSFLEMGFAHALNKKVYLLNQIPEVVYKDEIIAMQPIVINGDINKIKING